DGTYATRGYGEMDRLMWDLDGRLESLERRKIDLQLISPSPRTISSDGYIIGTEVARLMNRETANLVKRGAGRLGGMGVLPLGEPEFASVWDTLEELGLLIFMHATTAITRDTLGEYTLNTVIAWPTEV